MTPCYCYVNDINIQWDFAKAFLPYVFSAATVQIEEIKTFSRIFRPQCFASPQKDETKDGEAGLGFSWIWLVISYHNVWRVAEQRFLCSDWPDSVYASQRRALQKAVLYLSSIELESALNADSNWLQFWAARLVQKNNNDKKKINIRTLIRHQNLLIVS